CPKSFQPTRGGQRKRSCSALRGVRENIFSATPFSTRRGRISNSPARKASTCCALKAGSHPSLHHSKEISTWRRLDLSLLKKEQRISPWSSLPSPIIPAAASR